MTIRHHLPARLIRAYVAGSLPKSFATVVAAHISLCAECRAQLAAEELAAGAVLDSLPPFYKPGDERLREALLARLDSALHLPDEAPPAPMGIFPGPVVQALASKPPRWRRLGGGIRQQILARDARGSVRLLYIPPGTAVPEHCHSGLELTLVLAGSFADATGHYGAGDVEVADEDLTHAPVAGAGAPCICLAATDAPLRFHTLIPRLLQPLMRI